jgi:hypothetical protein
MPKVSPASDILATPCDGDSVCARNCGVILKAIHAIPQVLLLHTLLTLCQKIGSSGLPSSDPKGCHHPALALDQLTGSLYSDLQLPAASALCVHLEVSCLLHPYTFRLEAPANSPAGSWVTGCGQRGQLSC